jgi:hypothetical protein
MKEFNHLVGDEGVCGSRQNFRNSTFTYPKYVTQAVTAVSDVINIDACQLTTQLIYEGNAHHGNVDECM